MLFRPPSNGIEHPGEIIDYNNYYGQKGYVLPPQARVIVTPRNEMMSPLMIGIIAGVITFLGLWYFLNHLAQKEPVLDNSLSQEIQQLREQELQILFAQPYIDPLTDYILKYEENKNKIVYVQRARFERAQRCANVEKSFQQQKKNYWTLVQLTKGYNYSCPDVVTRFVSNI